MPGGLRRSVAERPLGRTAGYAQRASCAGPSRPSATDPSGTNRLWRDFEVLRRDVGLGALTGYALPSAPTARHWLERFHDEQAIAARPAQGSFIPVESSGLAGLRSVVERSVRAYVEAMPVDGTVTLDVDAHLVESHKRTALYTHEGIPGYQPVIVEWAETGLVLADEFRDGNVPASRELARMVDQAYEALPAREGGWQVRVRSDSAAYEYEALDHWQERGWKFAVSADMSPQLRAEIEALPLEAWQEWGQERSGVVREWAEVAYVPSPRRVAVATVERRKSGISSLTGMWPSGYGVPRGCCLLTGRLSSTLP